MCPFSENPQLLPGHRGHTTHVAGNPDHRQLQDSSTCLRWWGFIPVVRNHMIYIWFEAQNDLATRKTTLPGGDNLVNPHHILHRGTIESTHCSCITVWELFHFGWQYPAEDSWEYYWGLTSHPHGHSHPLLPVLSGKRFHSLQPSTARMGKHFLPSPTRTNSSLNWISSSPHTINTHTEPFCLSTYPTTATVDTPLFLIYFTHPLPSSCCYLHNYLLLSDSNLLCCTRNT